VSRPNPVAAVNTRRTTPSDRRPRRLQSAIARSRSVNATHRDKTDAPHVNAPNGPLIGHRPTQNGCPGTIASTTANARPAAGKGQTLSRYRSCPQRDIASRSVLVEVDRRASEVSRPFSRNDTLAANFHARRE
jgi:hypothetical protein